MCRKILLLLMLAAVVSSSFAGMAEASATSSGEESFPWEGALQKLANSLTGPVAFSLGLFMIVCGFCAVAFAGAEMGAWVRWVAMAAILAGMLGAAPSVLKVFGLQPATILF